MPEGQWAAVINVGTAKIPKYGYFIILSIQDIRSLTKLEPVIDKVVQSVSILLTGIGAGLLMKGALPQWSFFTGGAALFVGTIILEGISMSLTSKVSIVCPPPQHAGILVVPAIENSNGDRRSSIQRHRWLLTFIPLLRCTMHFLVLLHTGH